MKRQLKSHSLIRIRFERPTRFGLADISFYLFVFSTRKRREEKRNALRWISRKGEGFKGGSLVVGKKTAKTWTLYEHSWIHIFNVYNFSFFQEYAREGDSYSGSSPYTHLPHSRDYRLLHQSGSASVLQPLRGVRQDKAGEDPSA